jgi:ankyrin repeat protein
MNDMNRQNLDGESPLFLAAAHGQLPAVKQLLDNGVSSDDVGQFSSMLLSLFSAIFAKVLQECSFF